MDRLTEDQESIQRIMNALDKFSNWIDGLQTLFFTDRVFLVKKSEFKGLLKEIKDNLPDAFLKSNEVLTKINQIVSSAETTAQKMITDAEKRSSEMIQSSETKSSDKIRSAEKRSRELLDQHEITQKAKQLAANIQMKAERDAKQLATDTFQTTHKSILTAEREVEQTLRHLQHLRRKLEDEQVEIKGK